MTSNYEEIKEYLLGGLGSEERELIELRIIDDEEFGNAAQAAEDRLIESYVDGELSDEDTERFRLEYLVSEERVRRVKEFTALRAAVAASTISVTPAERPKSSIAEFFNSFRPITALVAAAFLLIAVAGLWFYVSDGKSALEREYATLNRGDMSDLSRFGSYSAVELVHGTFRSGDSRSTVAISSLSEAVLFRLPLTFDPGTDALYDIDVLQEGKPVFTVADVKPVKSNGGIEIRVLLPREVIKSGDNQISVSQPGTQLSPVLFPFRAH